MNTFKAFLITDSGREVTARFVDFKLEDLDPGEVLVEVAYSDINYKDVLAATGKGKILRRPECIGGVDFSGVVVASDDPRFSPGDEVLAVGNLLGTAHHGGFARFARVPGDWLHKLPAGMSLWDAMAFGTAGFTAAISLLKMEANGLNPTKGPVIVSGATGGVGSIAIGALAKRGYQVIALTGKADQEGYLRGLGASEIMLRGEIQFDSIKPLEPVRWAGAIDNLGGNVLAWIVSSTDIHGVVTAIGMAAGAYAKLSVMPFILRGVSVLGISSAKYDRATRETVWHKLAGDFRPARLRESTKTLAFCDLPMVFDEFIQSNVVGRYVVDVRA